MVSNVRRVSVSGKLVERLIAAAQVASLFATGWFVWIYRILPRLGLESLTSIAAQSLFYVILAWICGGIVTFCLYIVISLADLPGATRFSLRTSAPAMWFAPAIVLLSTPLPAAFAISVFLVANATRQLISQWGVIESALQTAGPAEHDPAGLFQAAAPDAVFLSWKSAPVLMASLTAQAGLVALLFRYQFRAAALFALSTAILTFLSITAGLYHPAKAPVLPHSALSLGLTFLLAASITFGGISIGRGGGGASDPAASDADSGDQSDAQRVNQAESPPDANLGVGGDFPGVILLPEKKPHVALLVPVMAPPTAFGTPLVKPVGIPFTGPYWMFRWPAIRPPRRSVVRRGSPSGISFHTTDGWPMEMEAHQRLDMPVSVHCCSQIQLAIQNSDPFPGTVSLELILIDTSQPIHRTQTLGSVAAGPPSSTAQILSFRVATAADFQKFDEIKVVFHRTRVRMDKSARIAIERFVLAP